MAVEILARIPENNGQVINWGGVEPMTVGPEKCDRCEVNDGVVVIRGETDSFGFEPIVLCGTCLTTTEQEAEAHDKALDVEDKEGFFYVSECTNIDGHGDWFDIFTSYRAAVAFLRRIERRAERWGGLYPGEGVRVAASMEELQQKKRVADQARRDEEDYLASLDEESDDPDPPATDDWDDFDDDDSGPRGGYSALP